MFAINILPWNRKDIQTWKRRRSNNKKNGIWIKWNEWENNFAFLKTYIISKWAFSSGHRWLLFFQFKKIQEIEIIVLKYGRRSWQKSYRKTPRASSTWTSFLKIITVKNFKIWLMYHQIDFTTLNPCGHCPSLNPDFYS